ncbi:MAG: 50S ribosomal protein L17 [Bacteroidales bacterium]|nr:50S ribosomal protein L17 [Bacteroidales bacterium]
MRHRKNFNHLSRKSEHRKAMLANMATSLIMHKRINTTLAKARALRTYVEPLITKSKLDTTHSRRVVFSYLQSKDAVTELFREVSVKVAERPGGYTRIIKTGTRLGDNAEMCLIELVDFNENLLGAQDTGKSKTARRRRGAGKKKAEVSADEKPAVVKKSANEPPVAKKPAVAETGDKVTAPEQVKESPEVKTEEKAPEAIIEENAGNSEDVKDEGETPDTKGDDSAPEKK